MHSLIQTILLPIRFEWVVKQARSTGEPADFGDEMFAVKHPVEARPRPLALTFAPLNVQNFPSGDTGA